MDSKTAYLHSSFLHGEGASNFGSTTTIYDPVISDKVSDNTESIVYRALGFINDLGDGSVMSLSFALHKSDEPSCCFLVRKL
jgi:hypothetical protein